MKRKRKDVLIESNRKYNGVLYTSKRHNFSEEDLIPTSQTSRVPRVRKPAKKASFLANAKNAVFTKLGVKQSNQPGGTQKKDNKPKINPFRDTFVRTTIFVCIAIIGISFIAIPTTMARKTTNIRINDNGRVFEADTTTLTVGEFLKENEVVIGEEDILEANLSTPIKDDMEIVIRRAMPITVRTMGEEISINMIAGTVQEALDKAGVTPAPEDEVYPAVETFTRPEMIIDHIIVETKKISDYREIPFKSTEREDKTLAKGSTKTTQSGQKGELEIITKQIYKNGVLISEEVVSEEVIKEPVTEIISVGTYVKPAPKPKAATKPSGGSSSGGGKQPTVDGSGKYILSVTATAYCAQCNTGNKTSTGTYPQRGTIAANPSILPYGTVIEIPGYGTGRIEDTGGFARANPYAIDVFLDSHDQCTAWGRKSVQITVH